MRTTLVALAGALGAVAVVAAAALGGGLQDDGEALLPDLVVKVPYELELTSSAGRWRLGFASAASNLGAGPLVVQGRRRPGVSTMFTVQEIRRSDGSRTEVRGAGRLRYVVSPDHAHWHFTPFMRYELRPAGRPQSVARDRKTGFCLGDRYDAGRRLAGKPSHGVFTGRCGLREPWRLGLRQGISVGYGDDYDPTLEGQFVDVTRLAAGRYWLVHRVNESRALRESSYDNNVSALLVELSWADGRPAVAQLQRCRGRAAC